MKMKKTKQACAIAAALMIGASGAATAQELVIATTGGLMRNVMDDHMHMPFQEQTGIEVIPFDIEVPDQWVRAEGMMRTGNVEFDIVTSTAPDLIDRRDMLQTIPCEELENVMKYGLDGACKEYGVGRTVGGAVLAYDTDVFGENGPQTWADFWNVEAFPGPRGLQNTGDCDWWVPVIALLADGVAKEDLFPLDIDRAYAKLDEIKPHINVWWKNGNQVQQIMRDKEVVMTMAYSGRATTIIEEGGSWAMSWDGAVLDTAYFSILKGAKHTEEALKFIDFFYGNADGHPPFINAVNYATYSTAGLAQMPAEEQKLYAAYPANYEKIVQPDFAWIGQNREMLKDRWNAWITR